MKEDRVSHLFFRSLNKHSAFGPVVNPIGYKDEKRSAGGSSGGSAASVATGMCTA